MARPRFDANFWEDALTFRQPKREAYWNSESPPVITRKTENVEAEEGSRVDMTCVASGKPAPEIKWWKYEALKDFQLLLPNQHFIQTKMEMNDEVIGTLSVTEVNPADSGQYVCTAINQHGSVRGNVFLQVNTQVTQTIPNPRIVIHPQDTVAESDESASLDCLSRGEPRPTISWYKDGHLVVTAVQNPAAQRLLLRDGSLFFLRVKGGPSSDEGVYYCRASNEDGSVVSRNATLLIKVSHDSVSVIPRIITVKLMVAANGSVFLYCLASGSPAPDMTWWEVEERAGATEYHQLQLQVWSTAFDITYVDICVPHFGEFVSYFSEIDERDLTGGRMTIGDRKDGEYSTLVLRIDQASPQDAGNYRCIASNTFGKSIKDLQLEDPLGAPAQGLGPSPETPVTDVTTPPPRENDLGISAVPGRASEITRVVQIDLDTGEVRLVCEATGFPTPKISWWKQEASPGAPLYHLMSTQDHEIYIQHIDGTSRLTLTLAALTTEDLGTYQCTADNYLGQSKKTLQVTGNFKDQSADDNSEERTLVSPVPLLTTTETTTQMYFFDVRNTNCRRHGQNIQVKPSTELAAKLGDGLVLTCDYSGYDPVFIQSLTWYTPEGQPFKDANTSSRVSVMSEGEYRVLLFIKAVRQQDAGLWTCHAVLDGQMRCGTVSLTVWKDITFVSLPLSVNGVSGQDVVPHVLRWTVRLYRICRGLAMGDQLPRDVRYIYTHHGLLIHDLEKGDAGKYLCEAKVSITGRYDAREISLYVDGK
ncbi:hemicentin-2-like [Liolophura sinensis]|uniref:hemicentin-2-like n=1 Tax=Liolophura sinensis TaxID=3198878 RepID=UPI0031587946